MAGKVAREHRLLTIYEDWSQDTGPIYERKETDVEDAPLYRFFWDAPAVLGKNGEGTGGSLQEYMFGEWTAGIWDEVEFLYAAEGSSVNAMTPTNLHWSDG